MNVLFRSTNRILRKWGLEVRNFTAPVRLSKSDFGSVDAVVQDSDDPIYLVYQMGKVGSSSIHDCLLNTGKYSFHICHLSDWTSRQYKFAIQDDYCPTNFSEKIMSTIAGNEFTRFRISAVARSSPERIKVITATREPVSHLLSTYFEGFEILFKHYVSFRYGSITTDSVKQHLNELVRIYLEHSTQDAIISDDYSELRERFPQTDVRWFLLCCQWPLIWFDRELRGVLDIDIYSEALDLTGGQFSFTNNGIEVLGIKFESLSTIIEPALRRFTNDNSLTVTEKNVSRQKAHGTLFERVIESIDLPAEFLDLQYSHQFSRFFYTPDELENFKERWTRA